jgi:hypothetical protein
MVEWRRKIRQKGLDEPKSGELTGLIVTAPPPKYWEHAAARF